MDTENNVQIGGMRYPLKKIFGYEGLKEFPTFPEITATVEKEGFTTSDIDYLALMKDGDYEDNKMKLRTRQLFSMIPWNATPVDIGLSLRGVLKEGYGGYAAGDVIFVSDERSIVIQTIYTREIVTIGTKVFKRWNSYNEVFFVCEYVRDPRIVSTDGLNFMFKSINADRFKNNEFGSRFLVTKNNAEISKGSKIIVGSSVSYPVDRILKKKGMSMKQIDKFWNTLKENYEANDVDYLNNLLSFEDDDTELLQTEFKIRSNISYEIEEFKIEDKEEGKVGTFKLKDEKGKIILHKANDLSRLSELLSDWDIKEFNKTIKPSGDKDNLNRGELYYKIEHGGVYGHVKYSVDGIISGIMDDGTEIKKINPGDKLVFLHPANGLLSTPEFGYSVIYDGGYRGDPSNIKQMDLLVKNTAGTETAVAGLIYKEWNNITVTDKINQIYTQGLQLNIGDKKYDLNICPMLWYHKLSMRWGEGTGEIYAKKDGGYKTIVEEEVKCAYKAVTEEDGEGEEEKDKWRYIKFNREDEFVDPSAEDDLESDVPIAGKPFNSISKQDLIDKETFDKIKNWREKKYNKIKEILAREVKRLESTSLLELKERITRIKDNKLFEEDVEKLLLYVKNRIKENWRGGNTLEYNIFVDLLQFGLDISSKNTVRKIRYILLNNLKNFIIDNKVYFNVEISPSSVEETPDRRQLLKIMAIRAKLIIENKDTEAVNAAKNLIISSLVNDLIADYDNELIDDIKNIDEKLKKKLVEKIANEDYTTEDAVNEKLEIIKKNGVIKEFINMLKGLIKDRTMHKDYKKIIEVLTSLPETETVLTSQDIQRKSEKMLQAWQRLNGVQKIQKIWRGFRTRRNVKKLKKLKELPPIECRIITLKNLDTDLIFIQKPKYKSNIENLMMPYLDSEPEFKRAFEKNDEIDHALMMHGRVSKAAGSRIRAVKDLVDSGIIKLDSIIFTDITINPVDILEKETDTEDKWLKQTDYERAVELYTEYRNEKGNGRNSFSEFLKRYTDKITDKVFTNQVLNKIIDNDYNLIKITKDETNYEKITLLSIFEKKIEEIKDNLEAWQRYLRDPTSNDKPENIAKLITEFRISRKEYKTIYDNLIKTSAFETKYTKLVDEYSRLVNNLNSLK